jgi:HK97 family phage prohead protease
MTQTNQLKTKDTTETRFQIVEKLEIRESQNANSVGVLHGYAALYESETDMIWFREVIKTGAFKRAIEENQDVRGLWNHDTSLILGRTNAGTLVIVEDSKGLRFELDLPDTTAGRDAKVSIERGDITGMSFGFRIKEETWVISDDRAVTDLREITDLDLMEISPVTFPAYKDTEVGVRSLDKFKKLSVPSGSDSRRSADEIYQIRAARRRR